MGDVVGELWPGVGRPIIGMVHLSPLPGSPLFEGDFGAVVQRALDDAAALAEGGAHGAMIENFGDSPFYPRRLPAETVACMTRIAGEVRRRVDLPLGVNALRNDGRSALAIALAAGAAFIRVNVLCGARVTDQGVIEGVAHDLLRDRARLGAQHIRIFADVEVKHSSPLGPPRPIEQEVADTINRGLADALIVSGAGTGKATDIERLKQVKAAAGDTPVLVGSGVTAQTIREQLAVADAAIVGTAVKEDGVTTHPVDAARVRALVQVLGR